MRLELTRSQVFLELARIVFREQDHLEPTMVTILSNFLQMIGKPHYIINNYIIRFLIRYHVCASFEKHVFFFIIDCARCQILLSDPSDPTVFKRVFDMTKEECASLDCDFTGVSGQKRALPVNASIASEVARTNRKVNLRNLPLGEEVEE